MEALVPVEECLELHQLGNGFLGLSHSMGTAWIIVTFESQFLQELFVTIWSKHNIYSLFLTWLKNTAKWEDCESFALFGSLSSSRDIWFVVIIPGTWDFFLILKSYFDCLSGLDANLVKVNIVRAHVEFWNCQVGHEIDLI